MEFMEHVDSLKMWVQLMMPKIADQKALQSSVQEELIEMSHAGRTNSLSVLDQQNRYWASRGKLISKVIRYPEVKDWIAAIEELDEKEYVSLLAMLKDLTTNYSIIYDTVHKVCVCVM